MSGDDPSDTIDDKKWRHLDETVVESFFDRARQNLHCRIACGGLTCKHEDYLQHTAEKKDGAKPAIHGLNSNWVGDLIVASQRPSTCLFAKFNLIQQFQQHRISGVFNLQEKGEHAFCGPNGIFSDSGYSYNGERDLMRFGVSYYEFPWPDMTAPENDIVFRSVQCMDSHIKKLGRVLVHCHAGLGRTGLMIACYFIMCKHMAAKDAIELVRSSRPGAVQTSRQVAFVEGFETFSRALGFTMKRSPRDPFLDFASYMKRQYEFLHGDESRTYRFVPYHIHQILCRVIDLASTGGRNAANEALMAFSLANQPSAAVVDACRAEINQRRYDPEKTSNISLLVFLVLDWFRAMDSPFFMREHAVLFLKSMRNPRNFIRNIASMQAEQRKAKVTTTMTAKHAYEVSASPSSPQPVPTPSPPTAEANKFGSNRATTTAMTSINNTNYQQFQQQQLQQQTATTTTTTTTTGNFGGSLPTWQRLSPTSLRVSATNININPSATAAAASTTESPVRNQARKTDFSDVDDGGEAEAESSSEFYSARRSKPASSSTTTTTTTTATTASVPPVQQIAVVPPASPFYVGNHHFVAATSSAISAASALVQQQQQQQFPPAPTAVPESLANSVTTNQMAGSFNGGASTGSLQNQFLHIQQQFQSMFHKKPRIPWILQKQVEEELPREVRHTAALVLSAIATLVAEAAPIPSLLDLAIQSTVDAFTLNLPPATYHTFFYDRGSTSATSPENTNSNKNNNSNDNDVGSNEHRKRKMYKLAPDDRRLLYEAFTRWCAHEHSTYFDVFSASPSSTSQTQQQLNRPHERGGGTTAEVSSTARREKQDQRILTSLKNAAETRMPHFQSKMQNVVNNTGGMMMMTTMAMVSTSTSRSTTPQQRGVVTTKVDFPEQEQQQNQKAQSSTSTAEQQQQQQQQMIINPPGRVDSPSSVPCVENIE